jgi:hypothetical protein
MNELLTIEAFFQPQGESGMIPIGNVVQLSFAGERRTKTVGHSEKGWRRVVDELIPSVGMSYETTGDETSSGVEEILLASSAKVDHSQSAVVGGSFQIVNAEQGRWYELGKSDLSSVSVSVGGVQKSEITDYVLIAESGMLLVMPGGGIPNGSTVQVAFNADSVLRVRFNGSEQLLRRGVAKFLFWAQDSAIPIKIHTTECNLTVAADPEHTGEFSKFKLRFTSTAVPRIQKLVIPPPAGIEDFETFTVGQVSSLAFIYGPGWESPGQLLYRPEGIGMEEFEDYGSGTVLTLDLAQGWNGEASVPDYTSEAREDFESYALGYLPDSSMTGGFGRWLGAPFVGDYLRDGEDTFESYSIGYLDDYQMTAGTRWEGTPTVRIL